MKKLILIFLIILKTSAFSQDNSKQAKIKVEFSDSELDQFKKQGVNQGCEGSSQPISLYDEGGSLFDVKQQDQDGLKTCYANTASLILKSINPTLPAPSYLDLAAKNPSDKLENGKVKEYPFDHGWSCYLLNKMKENGQNEICHDSILENQPIEIQDEIIYKLHDVMNKYSYSTEQMKKLLNLYQGYLNKNPYPGKDQCGGDVPFDFKEYLGGRISRLTSQSFYLADDEIETEESQFCANLMQKHLVDKGLLYKIDYEAIDDQPAWVDYSPILSEFERHDAKYAQVMQTKYLASGKSYYNSLVELINSFPNSRSSSEAVLGTADNGEYKTKALNYQTQIEKMIKDVDHVVLSDLKKQIITGEDSDNLQKCWNLAQKNFDQPAVGFFYNNLNNQCFKDQNKWIYQINEETRSCHDPEKDLIDIFKTLTSLNQSVENINKFLVNKDKNILQQIINNNCKTKSTYQFPANDCLYSELPPEVATLENFDQWSYYQEFEEDLDAYIKANKISNDNVDLKKFADFWFNHRAKYTNPEEMKKGKEGILDDRSNQMKLFLSDIYAKFNPQATSLSKIQMKASAQGVFSDYKKKVYETQNKIVSSIKSGVAVGISTCGSLFSDSEKQNYKHCNNHAVTATGIKCENGRLKVQLTNSWGIACNEGKKTGHLFNCEKDIDGLTNGKSWVDFNYLSSLGLGLQAY